MRVIVCGGRDYEDRARVFAALDSLHAKRPITTIVHGDARGADSLAKDWALERGIDQEAHPADWRKLGEVAGPLRNDRMASLGADGCVAFPGGRGTADMVRRAEANGIKVWRPFG